MIGGVMQKGLHGAVQRLHFAKGHTYDRHAGTTFGGMYGRVAADVAAAAPPGGTVLDAGCGSGRLVMEIAKRRPDLQIHGIDLERGMVDVASQHAQREGLGDRVRFTAVDLAKLPLPDNSIDMVVSTASLHHWTDVGAVIGSLNRVLRPGGHIWIYDMRLVPAGKVRVASSMLGRRLVRTLVRTGRFPAALFQRLAIEPA
jgi:ubiquinone/menaquinone biosynthesis C-methylase UbiE